MLNIFGLPLVALLPFVGAAVVAYLARGHRLASAWGAGVTTLCCLILLANMSHYPINGDVLIQSWSWIEAIGLNFSFRLDGLGMFFAFLILGIGLLIIIYARYYLKPSDSMGRFYSSLLLFMGSMVGISLSENILQLVVFWELTSLSSFLLISFWQHKKEGRDGAMMALVVTGFGGLALLGGALILGHIVGSYELTNILASRDVITQSPLFTPMILLFLLGVLTKSAQFPFHFWLPHAMAAPTPVSAYLHSATMVKAGIFLLARFYPVLSGTPEWVAIVTVAGAMTLLIGSFVALFKDDLKGLLAYSTISHLGLIVLLFGLSTPLAVYAAIFHIMNHASFKASLFMVAGIVDHEVGTRHLSKLGGLVRFMPYTATLGVIGAMSMAGLPPFNGFLSKEMFFENVVASSFGLPLIVLVTIAGLFSVAYSIRFMVDTFFGKLKSDIHPHEAPKMMRIPVEFLILICFVVGIVPMYLAAPIVVNAVEGVLQGAAPEYHIALWHGFNLPLFMSAVAVLGGLVAYMYRENLEKIANKYLLHVDARVFYAKVVESFFSVGQCVNGALHKGKLMNSVYFLVIASLIFGFIGFNFSDAPLFGQRELLPMDLVSIVVAFILIVSALAVVYTYSYRMISLTVLGMVGLIVSIIFIKFSAPDLALTQLSVEVVTIILMLLALFFLPQNLKESVSKPAFNLNILLSILVGIGVFVLCMSVLTREYTTIGEYFLANSLSGGGGTNVVNVILVDFRGFDTMGEITVLAIAGFGIYAMLKGLKMVGPRHNHAGHSWSKEAHSKIMQTLIRILLPLMLIVAAYIFLRGHNLPGGGFIAGLIGAVALIVQYMANGISWTKRRLDFDKHMLIGSGVLIAGITGLVSVVLGYPFLTSAFGHVSLPLVGEFEIASAMAFDLGVFLAVVGVAVMILVQLGRLTMTTEDSQNDEINIKEI